MNAYDVAELIGIPTNEWEGKCHGIAQALLTLQPTYGELCRGHWLGPVHKNSLFFSKPIIQHTWIERYGLITDPTRWVFEWVEPYIYVGKNDYYDVGGNSLRKYMLTDPPIFDKDAPTKVYALNRECKQLVKNLLKHDGYMLTVEQRAYLLTLPLDMLGNNVEYIYRYAINVGDGAIIPIDNRNYVLGITA